MTMSVLPEKKLTGTQLPYSTAVLFQIRAPKTSCKYRELTKKKIRSGYDCNVLTYL